MQRFEEDGHEDVLGRVQYLVMERQVGGDEGGHVVPLVCLPHVRHAVPEAIKLGVGDAVRRELAGARFQHAAQLDQLDVGCRAVLPLRGGPQHGLER